MVKRMIKVHMTDEQLMHLVRKGELDSLSELFNRHHKKLYNFFLQLTSDAALSEDLTQNVFERIIKYRSSFRADSTFKAWMYTIARNVRIDHFRLNKVKIDEGTQLTDLEITVKNIHEQLEQKERSKALQKAIRQLKPEYREVLLLGWFEKMTYAEVGAVLGLTVSNVKVRMHRAIKQLKNNLGKSNNL